MSQYPVETINVNMKLEWRTVINGNLDMAGYSRFSEFLENDASDYLKLYNVELDNVTTAKFLVVPKSRVIWYEPWDDE